MLPSEPLLPAKLRSETGQYELPGNRGRQPELHGNKKSRVHLLASQVSTLKNRNSYM